RGEAEACTDRIRRGALVAAAVLAQRNHQDAIGHVRGGRGSIETKAEVATGSADISGSIALGERAGDARGAISRVVLSDREIPNKRNSSKCRREQAGSERG